jgi:hypothetical protein
MSICAFNLTRRQLVAMLGAATSLRICPSWGVPVDPATPQAYFAGVNRSLEALSKLGAPVAAADAQRIAILAHQNDNAAVNAAENILDRYTLARVTTDTDGYAYTAVGGAPKTLLEQGWTLFLVRVSNSVATTSELHVTDVASNQVPTAMTPSTGASMAGVSDTLNLAPYLAQDWLRSEMYQAPPMEARLSGLPVEYQVIQLYSRDREQHDAQMNFYTATDQYAQYGANDYRRGVRMRFDCRPSRDVALRVSDVDGRGCMASLIIKDRLDRVYPLQAMRLAPDMQFHPQIYRADGESVRLPDGEYTVETWRGPEYLRGMQTVVISGAHDRIEIQLQRWIDPAQWGLYSGDTHIHAAGCAHYEHPTEGVSPESMIRLVRGEALSIGDVLTWGSSWYYQRQFFSGRAESPQAILEHPELQVANNASLQPRPTPEDSESLLRYDVEVSGFPSSHCGHLVLLRLKEQDYPGTTTIQDWPSWNLPILRWARAQGAVAGYAHCGSGMAVDSTELPNYEIPPMDGIGTQEAIVDVTHGLVDFISGCDTQPAAELNAWYHLLNCGFRLALVGETDFPCITGDRPGVGRSYVRLDHRPVDNAGYEAWIRNLQKGKLYCGDGRSHFLEFKVNGRQSGEDDLLLKSSGAVHIEALIAARLEAVFTPEIVPKPLWPGWGWHLERARIGKTREIAVELLVNGVAVQEMNLVADGKPRPITFKTSIARSSWIALRILPSSHTHPVFAQVGGKPIRASRRSAQWCRSCVDKLWEVKAPFMRESERSTAAEAFSHARKTYDLIISECEFT